MTETHSKKFVRVKFRHPILFWGGLVGKIEDKVHLSPAEVEIGAELGKKNFEMIKSWAKRLQN